MAPPPPLAAVFTGDESPGNLARLLIGRDTAGRQAAVARYLEHRGIPFRRHPFTRGEGQGETYAVEIGSGDRVLVLCAHHDAVPGSPGANDNAAAVGVLLHLITRPEGLVPAGWRVRCLFTALEEIATSARECTSGGAARRHRGRVELELCGRGDAIALWDAGDDSPFSAR